MTRGAGRRVPSKILIVVSRMFCLTLFMSVFATSQSIPKKTSLPSAYGKATNFETPQKAADILVDAAEKFDVQTLANIFGQGGEDIVFSGEFTQDRKHAADFATQAREKKSISLDSRTGNRAFLLVGAEDWPFPAPLVKKGNAWAFDAKAGRQELLYRRIGANELDAIQICHGYVEAQYEYALQPREGYSVNQYAERIISSPGKQDGLAWQNSDESWGGPIGERIARAIEEGYKLRSEPYHGYFFKILKSQGPAAPLGEMDFVVKGVMIGGFALAAAPAEYGVTGLKSFLVSHDGWFTRKMPAPDLLKNSTRWNVSILMSPGTHCKRIKCEWSKTEIAFLSRCL